MRNSTATKKRGKLGELEEAEGAEGAEEEEEVWGVDDAVLVEIFGANATAQVEQAAAVVPGC